MHDVYSNGVLNIAASGASDSSEGCFAERNTSFTAPCKVTLKWKDGSDQDCFMQHQNFLKWHLDEKPLLRRGWVVQERLLAPHVVYFGKKEVFWQCHEKFASEMWPEQIPNFLVDQHRRPNGLQASFMLSIFRDLRSDWFISAHDQKKIRNVVYFIVKLYCNCQLSSRKDKLVAISGIAKDVTRYLRDKCLAGLWRTADKMDIFDQLMW